MKLLISTPYLSVVGGTEIETLTTAQELANSGKFKQVEIFCPYKPNHPIYLDLASNPKIKFSTYPSFFKNENVKKINKAFRITFNLKTSFLENAYWFLKRLKGFDYVYIFAMTSQKYYLPLLNNFKGNKCLLKFTIVYKEEIPEWKKQFLRPLKRIVVSNILHQKFLSISLQSDNVIVQDLIIANEKKLLQTETTRKFTFGMLCRFSKEKRIEQAIRLIERLNSNGKNATLIIQGKGDEEYFDQLNELIISLHLNQFIKLIKMNIPPAQTHLFYKNISFFLITSEFETGPLTGLEAMAAGIPVLSYNVGAMQTRFKDHDFLIVNKFDEMFEMAQQLIELKKIEYKTLSNSIRQTYISQCSNTPKVEKLEDLFFQK
ncbi:glycosyltransferase involved in cell wall biosynthesis [Gillisia sp. Hel_I_86]|uniref:glycosyltransferase n=1 Tax=Gillisia sp. Hel_I_86 TaxID=1249981 RepID=UPI001198F50E|nr:glycosyltransferase [Gillisia sp. Hel_I_86]TVZ25577.1 glycosyltransferase involved in cell wall biosynthesis [Gillisia sp. Hel_I_86]